MYRTFLGIIKAFLGEGVFLWLAPAIMVVAFLIFSNSTWLKKFGEAERKGTWWSLPVVFWANFLKLFLALGTLGILAAALRTQEGLFSEKNGKVTQRNYEIVKSKWGVPHMQRDLAIEQYVMQTLIIEKRADGGEDERYIEEYALPEGDKEQKIISDETVAHPSREEIKDNPLQVVQRIKKSIRKSVTQIVIPLVNLDIAIKSNSRQIGGAVYAGYEDQWHFRYEVESNSELKTQMVFKFHLPDEEYGVYDRIFVKVNGEDWIHRVSFVSGDIKWNMPVDAHGKVNIEIGYNSRGLEYFRYKPGGMREQCKVNVTLDGVPPDRLDFPIGCMPPSDDLRQIKGMPFTLHWDLSRAVSYLDIGVIVPTAPQPGYYITKLLKESPLGIALMSVLIVLTRWLIGKPFNIFPIGLCALAYYITYALMANFNDVMPFELAFILSAIPITIAIFIFWSSYDGKGFVSRQTAAFFALFSIGYPLAVLSGDASGAILNTGYVAILVYVMLLLIFGGKSKEAQN